MRELEALKRAGLFRERKLFDSLDVLDFASNDYLGLAENRECFEETVRVLRVYGETHDSFAPKASMLVNGYSTLHAAFEKNLAKSFGFESCALLGSGFLANIALIESLCRKNSTLFMDSEYHASGILGSRLAQGGVVMFDEPDFLDEQLKKSTKKQKIVAIEGVYSMSGRVASREIVDICDRHGALLIVDEAHSSGVLGKNLHGFFDHHAITPKPNHIKMGTLSKAYGSYGAFVCASREIVSFLENRAKPLIYSTALSLFDTVLASEHFLYIKKHKRALIKKIEAKKALVYDILGLHLESLILPLPTKKSVLGVQKKLLKNGFLVGAIRPPTIKTPQLRVILRANMDDKKTSELLEMIKGV